MKCFSSFLISGFVAIFLVACGDKEQPKTSEPDVAAKPAKTLQREWDFENYSKQPSPQTVKEGFLRLMDLGDWDNEIFLTIHDEESLDAAEKEVEVLLQEVKKLSEIMLNFDPLTPSEKEILMRELKEVMKVREKEREAKPRGIKNLNDMPHNDLSIGSWNLYHRYRKEFADSTKPMTKHFGL